MPASRSRTERWRECLGQLAERGGALEIALDRGQNAYDAAEPHGADIVWRVRILRISEHEVLVDHPSAMGRPVRLETGVSIVGVMTIGQNRWMFRTRTLGSEGPTSGALRLAMPQTMERCQRRSFYRVSAASLDLPHVECWPLLNPESVVAAEVANEALIGELLRARHDPPGSAVGSEPAQLLPDVGPMFRARLVNMSGGGVGVVVARHEASGLDRARAVWLRVDLHPEVPAPLAITCRVVHTHVDSAQDVHAGLAFEFGYNPAHRDFVVAQICRVVGVLQQGQRADQSRAA